MTDANDPIPQITRDDEAAGSGDLVRNNIARLKALFPEIVTDGKVDFDVLRELLGDSVEDGEERYGLSWKGKRRARAFALTPSLGTLRPAPNDSVDWDTTHNIVVEGDNLEVLKSIRRSYSKKIKLIYIDPPYNTGNDFVYPDDYSASIENYLSITGQRGDTGQALTSEREVSGRFHTDWLNMMYPRLMLAKELLRDDGLIFVSVDAVELANCKQLMEEVFGVERLIGTISRATGTPTGGGNRALVGEVDYLLVFGGSVAAEIGGAEFSEKDAAIYDREDSNGKYLTRSLRRTGGEDRREDRPTMYYAIEAPDGSQIVPIGPTGYDSRWICSKPRFLEMKAQGMIEFIKRERNGRTEWQVHQKFYLDGRRKQPSDFWSNIEGNKKATRDLKSLFDSEKIFSNPKPVGLIERIIEISEAGSNSIVLDFFAGSGTTGHAVMRSALCADGEPSRYILVQLPEPLNVDDREQKAAGEFLNSIGKPANIAELTKERLRRAGKKILEENPDTKVDVGFRVYKLATSNLKPWQPDADDLEASILDAVDNVLPGRTEEDLLVELLLKTGIDLTLPEETRIIAGRTVYALGGGTLMVCLGDVGANDSEALGQGMADWANELDPVQTTIYFKDTGLGADGNRAATKANLGAILRQRLSDRIAKIASI